MEIRYAIIFRGEIADGHDLTEVKRNFATLLKVDSKAVERFFSGQKVAIKKNVDHQTALTYQKTLEKIGVISHIEDMQKATPQKPVQAQGRNVLLSPTPHSKRSLPFSKTGGAVGGLFLVLIGTVIAFLPVMRDELHWRRVSRKDTNLDYANYLETWPDGRHAEEAHVLYDERSWTNALSYHALWSFERYLETHPEGIHAVEAQDKIDEFNWEQAETDNTLESYQMYMKTFPRGCFIEEARKRLARLHHEQDEEDWQQARRFNSIQSYQRYVQLHPQGKYFAEAQSKIENLQWSDEQAEKQRAEIEKTRRTRSGNANVVLEYPKVVHSVGLEYSWTTIFKEVGGQGGFELKATNFYIQAPKGGKWSNSWTETVRVEPGGSAKVNYWCDYSSNWAGGTYHTVWVGKDDAGNSIRIIQEVKLAR